MFTRWKITILQLFLIVFYRIRMRVKSEELLWSTIISISFCCIGEISQNFEEQAATSRGRLYDPDTRNRGSSVPTILLCMQIYTSGSYLARGHGSKSSAAAPSPPADLPLLSLACLSPLATLPLGRFFLLLAFPHLPRCRIQSLDNLVTAIFFSDPRVRELELNFRSSDDLTSVVPAACFRRDVTQDKSRAYSTFKELVGVAGINIPLNVRSVHPRIERFLTKE